MPRPALPASRADCYRVFRWAAAGAAGILVWAMLAVGPAARPAVSEPNQIARGREVYAKSCAACHGQFLEGRGGIPRLGGSGSRVRTNYVSAEQLHSFVSTAMPFNQPGKLEPQQYWDVVAFLWAANGVDPGNMVVGPDTAGKLTWDYKPSTIPAPGGARGQAQGGTSQGGLLSAAATAGVASVASAAVAAGVVFFVVRRRRQRSG